MIKPLERDPNVVDIKEMLAKNIEHRAALDAGELYSWKSFWGQLEPTKKAMLVEAIRWSGEYDIYLRRKK